MQFEQMLVKYLKGLFFLLFYILLTACGGGSGGGASSPTLTFTSVKTFRFNWTDISGATHYKLLENPDGSSGFTQVGNDIPQGIQVVDHIVPLYARINAQYIIQSCNATGCADMANFSVSGTLVDSIGYVKSSNTESDDNFGVSVSLSSDGSTLAVGATGEDSSATGINGYTDSNAALDSGAVYIFSRSGNTWFQQAYVKASNTESNDNFGVSVSLSSDGNTLAVGATGEDSSATGTNGVQANNLALSSGAVYVFSRSGNTWFQQAYVKASNTESNDNFGVSLSLSSDGNTMVVGASGKNNNAGVVYVFGRSSTLWSQQALFGASNAGSGDEFGGAVSLAADGNTLAVGAIWEDSGATGVNGDQAFETRWGSGAVYVFSRTDTTWNQQAYVKASNTGEWDNFGVSVSLSSDGNTLAVGATREESSAIGINGDDNDWAIDSGAVYVFTRSATTWSQQAYVKASNTESGDYFGASVSLSSDGSTLAVGAEREESKSAGINGDQTNDGVYTWNGAVYAFTRSGVSWNQQAYVKASNKGGRFGVSVSLAADGNILAVGGEWERSNATGISGDQSDTSAFGSGAVYLY